ncbi:MAG: AAA family ATPase [Hymenobacter sp.]
MRQPNKAGGTRDCSARNKRRITSNKQRITKKCLRSSISLPPPLAERRRPRQLADYAGQTHLLGESGVLRRYLAAGRLPSLILWGPPGVGKTTLALLLAEELKRPFTMLSAISAGVKDVREVIERARKQSRYGAVY